MKPFRWDLAKREQLGGLVNAAGPATYVEFPDDLRKCAARVVAFAGDNDLIFIGRSPETIFDYLSGIFEGSPWADRLHLLNVSMRGNSTRRINRENAAAVRAGKAHLASV